MNAEEAAALIVASLNETDKLYRKHASFWNFARKGVKEMGVFSQALSTIEKDLAAPVSNWTAAKPDPPDIELAAGALRIGVEITELVNQSAVEAQIRWSKSGKPEDQEAYLSELQRYGAGEAKAQLSVIVVEKEKKMQPALHRYDAVALLIYTDEERLQSGMFDTHCLDPKSDVFRWVYLLFSYDGAKYPLIRLQ